MSFLNAELSQPYSSLFYTYPQEDARLDADATRRAREFGAQSAASRGSKSSRGPALNTYNRIMSDYTTNKAATDRTNRLNYTNTMAGLMRSPDAVTPSTLSTLGTIGGTVGGALLKEAAPDIWKKIKWWDSSPKDLAKEYTDMAGGAPAVSSGFGIGEEATSGLMPYSGVLDSTPDFSSAYNALDSIPWDAAGDWLSAAPDFSDAYNLVSGLW